MRKPILTRRQWALLLLATLAACAQGPQPRVVEPGREGGAPSDAVVLFDGRDLSEWMHRDGKPAAWAVEDGAIVCKSGSGDILTRRVFGSAQIHVEFNTPDMPQAKDQAKGNSGVYLQGRYEIQILDSYRNPTYPNGSAGAIYGQHAPLVNASRPPGEWQTYDILFRAPKCEGGRITQPASVTILHNGVLVQDNAVISGPTGGGATDDPCQPGPLLLQDHFHPDVTETFLKFRNIWYRPLE